MLLILYCSRSSSITPPGSRTGWNQRPSRSPLLRLALVRRSAPPAQRAERRDGADAPLGCLDTAGYSCIVINNRHRALAAWSWCGRGSLWRTGRSPLKASAAQNASGPAAPALSLSLRHLILPLRGLLLHSRDMRRGRNKLVIWEREKSLSHIPPLPGVGEKEISW